MPNGPAVPPYTKPYKTFQTTAKQGDTVRLTVRKLARTGYTLVERKGAIVEMAPNCVILSGNPVGVPWHAIHDWEILSK